MSDIDDLPVEPVPEDRLRVGDAERHQAVMALGEHFATGRLDQQEFDDRVRAASGARTRRDLRRLFLDLPGPAGVDLARPTVSPPPPARPPRRLRGLVPLLLLVALIVSVTTQYAVLPFVVVGLVLVSWARRTRRHPGYDTDWWAGPCHRLCAREAQGSEPGARFG